MAKEAPQMRPASDEQAPDTARVYERAKPEKEAGMGRLDNNVGTPTAHDDKMEGAVAQKQTLRQINADEVVNERSAREADGAKIPTTHPPTEKPSK